MPDASHAPSMLSSTHPQPARALPPSLHVPSHTACMCPPTHLSGEATGGLEALARLTWSDEASRLELVQGLHGTERVAAVMEKVRRAAERRRVLHVISGVESMWLSVVCGCSSPSAGVRCGPSCDALCGWRRHGPDALWVLWLVHRCKACWLSRRELDL